MLAKMNVDAKNAGQVSLDVRRASDEILHDNGNLRFNIADKNIRVAYDKKTGELNIMEYKTSVPESLRESESAPMRYDSRSGMYESVPSMYKYVPNSKRIKVSKWEYIEDPIKLKNYKPMIKNYLMALKLDASDPRAELVKSLIEKL